MGIDYTSSDIKQLVTQQAQTNQALAQIAANQQTTNNYLNQLLSLQTKPAVNTSQGQKYYPTYASTTDINRYGYMTGGHTYILDLVNLNVRDTATGVVTQLSSANPALKNNVKSMLMATGNADTVIKEGTGEYTTAIFDHTLIHEFNNITQTSFQIAPPSYGIPNTIDLVFVLSSAPTVEQSYKRSIIESHTAQQNMLSSVSATGWTDLYLIHMGGYAQLTFNIQETGGVNPMNWRVQSANEAVADSGPTTFETLTGVTFPQIPASGNQQFTTDIEWHFYKVQVQCATSGQTCAAALQASPINSE